MGHSQNARRSGALSVLSIIGSFLSGVAVYVGFAVLFGAFLYTLPGCGGTGSTNEESKGSTSATGGGTTATGTDGTAGGTTGTDTGTLPAPDPKICHPTDSDYAFENPDPSCQGQCFCPELQPSCADLGLPNPCPDPLFNTCTPGHNRCTPSLDRDYQPVADECWNNLAGTTEWSDGDGNIGTLHASIYPEAGVRTFSDGGLIPTHLNHAFGGMTLNSTSDGTVAGLWLGGNPDTVDMVRCDFDAACTYAACFVKYAGQPWPSKPDAELFHN